MQGHAVLPNQPQVGIGDGRRLVGADPEFPFLGENALRRGELLVLPPLVGDIEELPNGGPANAPPNILVDVRPLVAGPVVVVNPAVRIEDEEVPVNDPLQQMEQDDLRAVWNLLNLPIDDNVITAQHLWQIMHNLRAILPKEGPYRIPSFQAEYARILRRMVRVMTIPTREMFEMTLGPYHSLGYDTLFQALQDSTPECPTEYGECLDKLCDHLTAAASLMPGADGIFIFKDREEFGDSLLSLAARLTSVQ